MLKRIFLDIICATQYVFIKDRHILDNITLAYDICNEFNSFFITNKFIAKVYLKEAFDMVD